MVLLVLGLELLEEVDQRLRALDGHGVVNARAQTADGLVALEVVKARAVITACPLCLYNLRKNCADKAKITYFTELLAEALGVKE